MSIKEERCFTFYMEVEGKRVVWDRLTRTEALRLYKLTEDRLNHRDSCHVHTYGWEDNS